MLYYADIKYREKKPSGFIDLNNYSKVYLTNSVTSTSKGIDNIELYWDSVEHNAAVEKMGYTIAQYNGLTKKAKNRLIKQNNLMYCEIENRWRVKRIPDFNEYYWL